MGYSSENMKMKDVGLDWIGEIPESWKIKRGKTILTLLERPIKEDDDVITCFRDGEVTLRKNRREDGFTIALNEIGYQGIEPGDLVVHGMDGFAGAIGISDSRGKATPVLNVMDSTENKRYIMYYLRMLAFRDVFLSLSTGIRVRSCDLRWNKLAVLPFIVPDRLEQDSIVSYLDDQCEKIDSIIIETKTSIEAYKKWRESIVFECVTRGIVPEIEMKEAKIPWVCEYPKKWNKFPIKRVILSREGGAWGDEAMNNTNDRICMRIADFSFDTGNFKRHDAEKYTRRNYSTKQIENLTLSQGDILIEKSGGGEKTPVGRAVMYDLPFEALYANFMERIVVNKDIVYPEYFEYYWRAMYYRAVTTAYIKQTTGIQNLNLSMLLEKEYILLPGLKEQENIITHLDNLNTKIESIINEKQTMLQEMEAYKKSLIYEVVTGKRKVV